MMALDWCDQTIQRQVPAVRYRDIPLRPQHDSAEIDAEVLSALHADLLGYLQQDPVAFARWFGCHVSEAKAHLQIEPAAVPLDREQFMAEWRMQGSIERNGWSKFLFFPATDERCYLFVSGQAFSLPLQRRSTIALLCSARQLVYSSCMHRFSDQESQELLCSLHNEGHLQFLT